MLAIYDSAKFKDINLRQQDTIIRHQNIEGSDQPIVHVTCKCLLRMSWLYFMCLLNPCQSFVTTAMRNFYQPVLVQIYAIMEGWLSVCDIATVQKMYPNDYHRAPI